MIRILAVCNHFAPDATIAAVRMTKLARYLKEHGYEVTFLAEKKKQGGFDEILAENAEGIKVVYAENSESFSKFLDRYKRWIKPYKDKRMSDLSNRKKINKKTGHVEFYPFETAHPVIGSLDYLIEFARQKNLFSSVKIYLKKADEFDYIITSYGDAFSWFCGCYCKKNYRNIPWHFDIRDAIYRYKFIPDYVSFIPRRMERIVWEKADVITGVSKGICARVPSIYRQKVHLLTNGYDMADYRPDNRIRLNEKKLNFVYTCSMYGGLQNLSCLFKAVGELAAEGKMSSHDMEFHYAGNESAYEIFKRQAREGNLDKNCVYHGKLARSESVNLQHTADILILASYDYEQNKGGIITGKVYEYMMAERPVVAIVTGDIKSSEVANIIRKTNIGFAYEEVHHNTDYKKLKEYIMLQYRSKFNDKGASYFPDKKEIEKYSYSHIGRRMVKIIEAVISSTKEVTK